MYIYRRIRKQILRYNIRRILRDELMVPWWHGAILGWVVAGCAWVEFWREASDTIFQHWRNIESKLCCSHFWCNGISKHNTSLICFSFSFHPGGITTKNYMTIYTTMKTNIFGFLLILISYLSNQNCIWHIQIEVSD